MVVCGRLLYPFNPEPQGVFARGRAESETFIAEVFGESALVIVTMWHLWIVLLVFTTGNYHIKFYCHAFGWSVPTSNCTLTRQDILFWQRFTIYVIFFSSFSYGYSVGWVVLFDTSNYN